MQARGRLARARANAGRGRAGPAFLATKGVFGRARGHAGGAAPMMLSIGKHARGQTASVLRCARGDRVFFIQALKRILTAWTLAKHDQDDLQNLLDPSSYLGAIGNHGKEVVFWPATRDH
jgi:hypothetical protein